MPNAGKIAEADNPFVFNSASIMGILILPWNNITDTFAEKEGGTMAPKPFKPFHGITLFPAGTLMASKITSAVPAWYPGVPFKSIVMAISPA